MSALTHAPSSWLRPLAFALVLGAGALAAPNALASEVKFAAEPFETKDDGSLTDAGRGAAISELASLPGEESWPLHIWAKLDKGAPGPLYVEFFDKLPGSGKRYMAWRYEHNGYEGEKYVSIEVELDGNTGFNKDHTYTVEVSQVNDKGRNIKLTEGKLKLTYTEPPEDEGDDDGEDEEVSEQDVLDSFAGGDEDGDGDEAPPEIAPPAKKKGCNVDPGVGAAPGVLVLLLLGGGLVRRRRR
ncbi:MAG: hypothetical protein AAF799_44230 [Myxococcota bacterium]